MITMPGNAQHANEVSTVYVPLKGRQTIRSVSRNEGWKRRGTKGGKYAELSVKNGYLSKKEAIRSEHADYEHWLRGKEFDMMCKQKSLDEKSQHRECAVNTH